MDIATTLPIRQIAPTFGAALRDMPVRGDVDDDTFAAFLDAFHRYHVLLIPAGRLDPAELVAFSQRLGPLEIHAQVDYTHPAHPEIFCVGNYEENGVRRASFSTGVEQWHADSSYRAVPSAASLFYGAITPPEGAATRFIDATAAYRDLPAATRARIDGLRAVHSLETLYAWQRQHSPWRKPITEEKKRAYPPVSHPLVRTHPVTGERSLFICPAVISHVEGLTAAASAALLAELAAHATQDRYVYRHRWTQGDLVIWDNRCTLHTATLFDHTRYQRLMWRTTVAGEA